MSELDAVLILMGVQTLLILALCYRKDRFGSGR